MSLHTPELQPQEIPLDHLDSVNMFRPGPDKPFLATPAAIAAYTHASIVMCLGVRLRTTHHHP